MNKSENYNKSEKYQPRILLVANVAKEHVLKFHVPTIKMLKEDGWYVDVACSGEDKIPYCNNQYKMSYKRSPFTFETFKGIKELKRIIDNVGYDIIYCHTPVGGIIARLAARNARKKGTKIIYFSHGYHFYRNAPKLNWIIFYPIEKIMSKMTDSIILCNLEDYKLTKKKFCNCNAYKIDGIGVDMSRFKVEDRESIRIKYRTEMNIPQDAIILIYLAELLHNKNQTFLMDILKLLLEKDRNIYLVLAGFDHSNGEFAKYAEKIGVSENIRFLGWREDVGELYATSDICTPTSIREGFGMNLVEAMACGIPVVATRNRGHETIIRDGVNGFLVELGDTKYFARKILQVINDNELRKKFIEAGIADKEKFSSEAALKNIKMILKQNMNENSRGDK